jgi:hypothetical protein
MSNDVLMGVIVAVTLAHLCALISALVWRAAIGMVMAVNILFGSGVLVYWAIHLPTEIRFLISARSTEIVDYKTVVFCLIEIGVLLSAAFGLFRKRALIAVVMIWIGFATNFTVSVLALVFVLTFNFRCCGYL